MAPSVTDTGRVQEAFGIVIFVVVGVAIVAAIYAAAGSGSLYQQIGRGGLSLNEDDDRGRPLSGAASRAVADEEIRQMLGARNARREARGEAPLDVEAELARLTAPALDPQLESEIRQLVVARNERRRRQGKPPLEVEEEVRRQIAELGGTT
jgi:parvulin-like peptidyl-prolyl isomerase